MKGKCCATLSRVVIGFESVQGPLWRTCAPLWDCMAWHCSLLFLFSQSSLYEPFFTYFYLFSLHQDLRNTLLDYSNIRIIIQYIIIAYDSAAWFLPSSILTRQLKSSSICKIRCQQQLLYVITDLHKLLHDFPDADISSTLITDQFCDTTTFL